MRRRQTELVDVTRIHRVDADLAEVHRTLVLAVHPHPGVAPVLGDEDAMISQKSGTIQRAGFHLIDVDIVVEMQDSGLWAIRLRQRHPPCVLIFGSDGDVDGADLAVFAVDFGRTDCAQ